MSEQSFSQLKHLIGHLPKSKLLAGASLSDGKFKFYLSGKKQGRINEAISNKDAVIMGDGGVANIAYAEGVYSYSSHNFGFFSEKESVETQYIYRALENFLPVIDYKGFVGSGIKNIDKSFLFDLYLQIPPLPEQKKIASILTSVDEVIENTQKQIDKLQDLKEATMNELLTKGIGHTDFKDSELGRIPKSWEVRRLSDCCDRITNGFVGATRDIYRDNGIPYILCQNIRPNHFVDVVYKFVSDEFHQKNSRSELRKGDILTVQTGAGNGDTCVVPKKYEGSNCHALIISRPKRDIVNSYFLSNFLGSNRGKTRIGIISTGGAHPHLNTTELRKEFIPVPSIMEQEKIISILSPIENNISQMQCKLSQTQSLKKSLMQDLLTGKVRVTVN